MKIFWVILASLITLQTQAQQASFSNQWIEFDQSFLKLWLKAYDQSTLDNEELQKCIYDWKKLKTFLDYQFVLDPHSNHAIRSFDEGISRIKPFIGSEIIEFQKIDLMRCDLMELRSSFSLNYPTDQIWNMLDSYKTVRDVLHDPMMDLLEWTEFSVLVNDLFARWEELHYTKFGALMSPNKLDEFEDLRVELSECMVDFQNSFKTANQGKMTLECDKIEPALINILRILSNNNG